MITSIAPDRTTATIDGTIIVNIVGGVNQMPANQRMWCFEAIDTCAFDWMRLATAQGLPSHDAILGQAGNNPAHVTLTCGVVPREDIPRFEQGEYGYGVWGDPRLPENRVYIWDGLGASPPPFGGRVFFKETVIHALGDIATAALAPQKDPWKLAELGMAMGLGTIETEQFPTPNTPPDLLMPPDHRWTQAEVNALKKPNLWDAYNAWFGVGRHIKILVREDTFIPDPDFPDTTNSVVYNWWGYTMGLNGAPGRYNPEHPVVIGSHLMQEHYVTVDVPPWDEDPREFMAEAFKDIYAADGSYRFTNRTKLKADYRVVDKHFSVLLPLGASGYIGGAQDDIVSAIREVGLEPPPAGTSPHQLFQNELEVRTGLPHSKITQHSVIAVKPWGQKGGAALYGVTVTTTVSQQTDKVLPPPPPKPGHAPTYEQQLTFDIHIDEPPRGESEEDWLAGVGLGTLGSQIHMAILVNITTEPGDSAIQAKQALNPAIWFGNSVDGTTEVSPFLAGVPLINRTDEYPLNIQVEWHAHSRRGPGRLQTGVVHVKGWDDGTMIPADLHMGRGVTVPDQHMPSELDSAGTGYPALPLTVNGI